MPHLWVDGICVLFRLMDYGYHYDPIDVAVLAYVTNATVTVLPGTVLATYGGSNWYGIALTGGSILNCQGTATSPIYIVRYNTVQEQSTTNFPYTAPGTIGGPSVFYWAGENGDPSSVYCRFTIWSQLAGGTHFFASSPSLAGCVGLQDCQLFGGLFTNNVPAMYITNCLFQRVDLGMCNQTTGFPSTNLFNNNLMVGGALYLQELKSGDGPWSFQNNLFDQTFIQNLANTTALCGYNAYVTLSNGILTSSTHTGDQVLTNSPPYQIGPLGHNYYPSGSSLIHAGSMLASTAGLYHYTVVTTNNSTEGTNIVSIGFHYVAVDAYGNPLDTNGDGVPDYLEDANGNGRVDSGEVAWNLIGDLGLQVWITEPKNNSTIP